MAIPLERGLLPLLAMTGRPR